MLRYAVKSSLNRQGVPLLTSLDIKRFNGCNILDSDHVLDSVTTLALVKVLIIVKR